MLSKITVPFSVKCSVIPWSHWDFEPVVKPTPAWLFGMVAGGIFLEAWWRYPPPLTAFFPPCAP